MNSHPLYHLKKVKKTVNDGRKTKDILSDIFLEIYQGEFLGIIGESGAGKSTLLNILGGMEKISHGQILFNQHDISKNNSRQMAKFRREIGFIFQSFQLINHFDVQQNVSLPLILKGLDSGKIRKQVTKNLIRSRFLKDMTPQELSRLKQLPNTLSGGEQQRVAIARAIINQPQVILADEPTGNLDSENEAQILNLLEELNQEFKITIVIVSHSPKVVERCKRLVRLADGKKVLDERRS
jgi:ABC-type lipoprotein export system ATPase subunit